ncbi:hypothetical protein BJP36_14595 [Moorena producens JHB]|uniref:Uncharacterized protein n=1 Tax=Moorena producens (strain JHB) TaxID=1454205 RepID=A0A9Q9SUT0_MOOP1|nr:hypothetical protein [Moorena producens]WAN70017.1 hypothetical protein BJP36_14595 [Moorena producens JHB]
MGCGVWGVGCGVWGVGCGVWGVGCGVWAREEEGAKKNYCIVEMVGTTGISGINGISKVQGFQKTIALSQFKEEADP